jgi:hypothetical protein
MYVDIANFDKYDMVIGTPFMYNHQVKLDFESQSICINGTKIPAISITTEKEMHICRHWAMQKTQE